jgi:hypothetical protein
MKYRHRSAKTRRKCVLCVYGFYRLLPQLHPNRTKTQVATLVLAWRTPRERPAMEPDRHGQLVIFVSTHSRGFAPHDHLAMGAAQLG